MITNQLKSIREKYKLTQTELADAMLTTRQTIYAIEKNKSSPSLEISLRIAAYFDVKVEDIFQLKKKPTGLQDTDLFTIF